MTCAKTSKMLLENVNVKTPSAFSGVHISPKNQTGIEKTLVTLIGPFANADNPYKWNQSLTRKYGYPIEFISPKAGVDYNRKELYFERRGNVNESLRKKYIWILKKGDKDPLIYFRKAASPVVLHGKF